MNTFLTEYGVVNDQKEGLKSSEDFVGGPPPLGFAIPLLLRAVLFELAKHRHSLPRQITYVAKLKLMSREWSEGSISKQAKQLFKFIFVSIHGTHEQI